MHSNGRVRFGGRAGETGREQSRYRAPARPLLPYPVEAQGGTSKWYVYTFIADRPSGC